MAKIEIKKGLGMARSDVPAPIPIWHVVVDGLTRVTFASKVDAKNFVKDRYGIPYSDTEKLVKR
jgi:hypothetical protein